MRHATEIGLAKQSILNSAESRLRSARLYDSEATHFLYINVNVFSGTFSTSLELHKLVWDPLILLAYSASTWDSRSIGTHGRDASYILSSVSRHMDEFLVEFLRVNEEACS